MKIGDYVRTKKRGFQFPQIARIESISKDSGYKNQCFIELDHNLLPDYEYRIYEEDIDKSSPNIIDLIEVGDIITNQQGEIIVPTGGNIDELKDTWKIFKNIKSIVTKEQFESCMYKVSD